MDGDAEFSVLMMLGRKEHPAERKAWRQLRFYWGAKLWTGFMVLYRSEGFWSLGLGAGVNPNPNRFTC